MAAERQWVTWAGGPCPVPPEAVIFALCADDTVNVYGMFAKTFLWERDPHPWSEPCEVVAYYVVTEDVATLSTTPHINDIPRPPGTLGMVAAPTRCGSYECRAAQQDGILCADGECDRVNGVRPDGGSSGK